MILQGMAKKKKEANVFVFFFTKLGFFFSSIFLTSLAYWFASVLESCWLHVSPAGGATHTPALYHNPHTEMANSEIHPTPVQLLLRVPGVYRSMVMVMVMWAVGDLEEQKTGSYSSLLE